MNPNVQWIGLFTLIRKEVTRIFRIWTQTLLPSVVTTTLYFLIFGQFIGERIGIFNGYNYIDTTKRNKMFIIFTYRYNN